MKNFGLYLRESDNVWRLKMITDRETALIAEVLNARCGFQTLIVGPLSVFPQWLET